jgi:hypothetical protein
MDELIEVADTAFAKAREENRRLGIPNGFEQDGKLLWELPDGTITDVNPFAPKASAEGPSQDRDRG